jgi:hypothetical protein
MEGSKSPMVAWTAVGLYQIQGVEMQAVQMVVQAVRMPLEAVEMLQIGETQACAMLVGVTQVQGTQMQVMLAKRGQIAALVLVLVAHSETHADNAVLCQIDLWQGADAAAKSAAQVVAKMNSSQTCVAIVMDCQRISFVHAAVKVTLAVLHSAKMNSGRHDLERCAAAKVVLVAQAYAKMNSHSTLVTNAALCLTAMVSRAVAKAVSAASAHVKTSSRSMRAVSAVICRWATIVRAAAKTVAASAVLAFASKSV